MSGFATKLEARVASSKSLLCIGLDPHVSQVSGHLRLFELKGRIGRSASSGLLILDHPPSPFTTHSLTLSFNVFLLGYGG